MATYASIDTKQISFLDANRRDVLGLVLSATLPFAVFVIFNGIAGLYDVIPLFFAPRDLPGWIGAALHLIALPSFGIARWMVSRRGERGRRAGWWLVGLMAGVIVFPFIVAPLDSLSLAIVSMTLLVVGLGTMVRVGHIDSRAALIMAPGMAWMGFSALIGLGFAGWAPPFAVSNQQASL